MWRAFAPVLAAALVLVPLAWVVERRALERQNRAVIAAAQSVWDGLATGDVTEVFGADARLPAALRAEPMRNAECREQSLGAISEGVMDRRWARAAVSGGWACVA
jgi:O-acetyl-ADP-ribose deacetylase (regulator of RNase III)